MRRIVSAFVVILFAVTVAFGHAADRADTKQLLEKGEAAVAAGKLEEAESAFCAAATQERKNKEAQTQCDRYRQLAQAQRDTDHNHVRKGAADLAMKRFNAAENEFQAIKSGSFSGIKKEWLDKIALARAQAEKEQKSKEQERKLAEEKAREQAAEADATMQASLRQGIAAYEKNDFTAARKSLSTVGGSYQAEATKYIGNIDRYNRAMNDGAKYEKAGELKSALGAYQKAVAIKSNGPLNPKEKVASLQQVIAQTEEARKAEEAGPGPSEQDQALRSAIQTYYQGDYTQAEQQLAAYAGTSAKLNALARFYLGASRLCQSLLTMDEAQKERLRQSAIADLQFAKHTPEFVAPSSAVSPKVMEVYQTSVP